MPLGYTASFSTSHLRPYTGPPALVGATFYGTGGIRGPRGSAGPNGLSGPSGPTGMKLIGTYLQLDPTKPAYNYYVLEFADNLGNYVTAAPRGLTGTHGPVWNGVTGATAYFYNSQTCDAPVGPGLNAPCGFTGILAGFTYISPTYRPWGGHYGQSGATLSFRTIGVSGDLELYTDFKTIGTGGTADTLGICGPDAAVQYGTVTLQSENEIVYLTDSKNVKDSYGLTFNPPHPITSSGWPPGPTAGTTWGTMDVRFHNYSEHFYIHGNAIDGVVKDPFVIDLKEGYGNVHQIFAPFSLSEISAEFHPSKNPIVSGPNWLAPSDWPLGGIGSTAEFGEAISITMLIDGGPFGIEFSKDFYFSEDVKFTNGRDIINCLSYDHCNSWFCTVSGLGFGASVVSGSYGSCCNDNGSCQEYMTYDDCIAQWELAEWNEGTTCVGAGCAVSDVGSCCINIDIFQENFCVEENVNSSVCERFGGNWRQGTLCSEPCSNPCSDVVGACCYYGDDGQFEYCEDLTTSADCSAVDGYWQGEDSICATVNCSGTVSQGACCLSATDCEGPYTPAMCMSLGGSYKGNDTECESVDCDCCNAGFIGNGKSNEVIFKQRIMLPDRLPKLSGTVFNDKGEFRVSSVYEYAVENGVNYIRKFVPNNFNNGTDLSTISICLGCDRNLLGKDCIILVVPVGAEAAVAEAFGGVAYIGKSCEEVNCKERHGTNLIHTDMVVGKSLMGMNTTSTGKCKLKDGTIINGCDENYCVNALGGRWKKNNIPPNQKWVMTPSGGQSRKN
jgi:hypothetical protein